MQMIKKGLLVIVVFTHNAYGMKPFIDEARFSQLIGNIQSIELEENRELQKKKFGHFEYNCTKEELEQLINYIPYNISIQFLLINKKMLSHNFNELVDAIGKYAMMDVAIKRHIELSCDLNDVLFENICCRHEVTQARDIMWHKRFLDNRLLFPIGMAINRLQSMIDDLKRIRYGNYILPTLVSYDDLVNHKQDDMCDVELIDILRVPGNIMNQEDDGGISGISMLLADYQTVSCDDDRAYNPHLSSIDETISDGYKKQQLLAYTQEQTVQEQENTVELFTDDRDDLRKIITLIQEEDTSAQVQDDPIHDEYSSTARLIVAECSHDEKPSENVLSTIKNQVKNSKKKRRLKKKIPLPSIDEIKKVENQTLTELLPLAYLHLKMGKKNEAHKEFKEAISKGEVDDRFEALLQYLMLDIQEHVNVDNKKEYACEDINLFPKTALDNVDFSSKHTILKLGGEKLIALGERIMHNNQATEKQLDFLAYIGRVLTGGHAEYQVVGKKFLKHVLLRDDAHALKFLFQNGNCMTAQDVVEYMELYHAAEDVRNANEYNQLMYIVLRGRLRDDAAKGYQASLRLFLSLTPHENEIKYVIKELNTIKVLNDQIVDFTAQNAHYIIDAILHNESLCEAFCNNNAAVLWFYIRAHSESIIASLEKLDMKDGHNQIQCEERIFNLQRVYNNMPSHPVFQIAALDFIAWTKLALSKKYMNNNGFQQVMAHCLDVVNTGASENIMREAKKLICVITFAKDIALPVHPWVQKNNLNVISFKEWWIKEVKELAESGDMQSGFIYGSTIAKNPNVTVDEHQRALKFVLQYQNYCLASGEYSQEEISGIESIVRTIDHNLNEARTKQLNPVDSDKTIIGYQENKNFRAKKKRRTIESVRKEKKHENMALLDDKNDNKCFARFDVLKTYAQKVMVCKNMELDEFKFLKKFAELLIRSYEQPTRVVENRDNLILQTITSMIQFVIYSRQIMGERTFGNLLEDVKKTVEGLNKYVQSYDLKVRTESLQLINKLYKKLIEKGFAVDKEVC